MLSYSHATSATPLLGDTIGAAIRRTVDRWPDREALVVAHQEVRWSYRALWEESGLVARGLIGSGVRPGDRVGIWSPNRSEWVVTQIAAARIGAILVNINPAYRARELHFALLQSGTKLLLLSRGFRAIRFDEILASVRAELPELEAAYVFEDDWRALRASGAKISEGVLREREQGLQPDDPINVQYTSGTTGFPKGATLTHHNILNNGFFVAEAMRLTELDRVCVPVPFYHCFGMVMGNLGALTHGATLVIPGEAFDAERVLDAVSRERCTALYGVPTMFIAELEHPRFSSFDLSSLRTGIMAGSPCPIEVMRQVRDLMNLREVTICYGMTETSPVSTQTAIDDDVERQVSTVGRVHPHVEVKIVDAETGKLVERGTPGELCTRGYSVMLGYWRDEAATKRAIDAAGWMHTGDLATMDDAGYVKIVGRIKDMIIRGGENIYPREVEEFLYTHPDVADVQVIGVPSAKYGEEVMAWVRPHEGKAPSDAELVEFCRGKVATYKIPRYWKLVTEFPMTVTGKVQKYIMRERSIAELGLGVVDATKDEPRT